MRLILLGPPGSGKGTQGVRLAERLGVPQISTGDLFRKNLAESTELGRKAQEYMSKGQLVPDKLVLDMVDDRLKQGDTAKGFILDGFPRTIPQADGLGTMLEAHGTKIDHVVLIDLDDEEIVGRLSARRTCSKCGAIYHLIASPPKKENVCDKCGSVGTLEQREDDVPETIRKRLVVYHDQTQPLVDYYSKAGLLRTVDGAQSPTKVAQDIVRAVDA